MVDVANKNNYTARERHKTERTRAGVTVDRYPTLVTDFIIINLMLLIISSSINYFFIH